MSVNKVILVGNLGADVDLKYTPAGKAVAEMSIATTDKWSKDGQENEKTEWHRVKVWDKLAELCAKYLVKGRSVYVEGRIQNRSFDDKDGNKRYVTEIVASEVQFLGGGDKNESKPSASSGNGKAKAKFSKKAEPVVEVADDDLPF